MVALALSSYKNHIIHSASYVAIGLYAWRAAIAIHKAAEESGSYAASTYAGIAVYYLLVGFAVLAIKSEVTYMIKRSKLPPGDSGLPFVGHLLYFMRDPEAFYLQHTNRYGKYCTYNLAMTPVITLISDKDVRWSMTQERKGKIKAFTLPQFSSLLGDESILVKSGEEHRRLRKVFEPAFTPLAIKDYAATIDAIAQKQLAEWCKSGDFQEPKEWAMLTMRIFFVCAFGEADEVRLDRLRVLFEGFVGGFMTANPFSLPGTMKRRAFDSRKELDAVFKEVVEEFKATNPPESEAAKKSVLGRLCYAVDESGNHPTDQQLFDNLVLLTFAGFDTTKSSFGAIARFLKEHPHVEAMLVEEAKGFQQETLDAEQLKNDAPVLNAFLAETWRLAAVVHNHSTIALEDLEYKGYVIPKGVVIANDLEMDSIQNEERHPRASEFHVERWLPKEHPLYDPKVANTEVIDYNVMSNKYRTFNHGPHMCLGGHFAKLEVRIVLTRLLQKYRIETRNQKLVTFPLKQFSSEFKLTKREA